ncbi:transposase [Streptomyces agglomeratus]|uniref:transposase n=1 Tax=Streptomyces agglomeratus TaxID=285458 RepID=UPI000AAAEC33|nr:transposase [Streptomyces agglomeratus]
MGGGEVAAPHPAPSGHQDLLTEDDKLTVTHVLQFLLGLSDRQAAEAVRCRIDFKYAMAMELDDPGFHHSVLADLRDRLAEGDRADRLLDLALARLKEAGLVRERTTQRTDSTHVLAAVRDLTRLELITEAVRAALEEVAGTSPHLLDELVDEDWGRRYGRPVRLGKNPTKPKTRILATGNDAVRLLEHLYQHGADRASGPRIQALRQIMVQNYHRDAAGHRRWRTAEKEGGPGLPPSSRAVVSPYDTSARYARHGHIISWKGFSAHLTETCAPDGPNVITDVATTAATTHDSQVLPGIHTRLAPADSCPPSTWSMPAIPPCPAWNKPPENTRSPSLDHCGATPPVSTAGRGLRPGRLPHRLRPSRSPAPRARSAKAGTAPTRPPPHRRPADRGQVHQKPVPALPGPHPVHHHRRQRPHRGLSPARAPRPATSRPHRAAFQNYLDQREIPRPKSWRILGT